MKKLLSTLCLGGLFFITPATFAADKVTTAPDQTAANSSAAPGNMVSVFARFNSAAEQTLLKVPADKHFVLTDIIGMASIEINQDNITRVKVQLGYSPDKNSATYQNPVSISTGIVFNPGTEVIAYPYPVGLGKQSLYGYITISGYFF